MTSGDSAARVVGVAEAAAHFGISTLRVRHRLRTGLLEGFRDNRGHWQVRLDGMASAVPDRPLDRDALSDMLVEELLEAKDRIEEQENAIQRLHAVVERQQTMLDRTMARLEAQSVAQPGSDAMERVRKTLDRLLALLETSIDQHEAAHARAERFRAMMARAIDLLETVAPGASSAAATGALARTLDQAMSFGARAVERAERSSAHAAQLDDMLERSLGAAEHDVENQKRAEARLKGRDELLERSLGLIEAASAHVRRDGGSRSRWFALFDRRTWRR